MTDNLKDRYAHAARHISASDQPAYSHADGRFGAGLYGPEVSDLPSGAVAASLGCGNPFALAELRPGETVLDLGSGGGIDVILSARRVGPGGIAYGIDMTPEMLELARVNAASAGVTNVEFLEGHIENVPLPDRSIDVVLSNCVVNLSPDKQAVFGEVARLLRPGGRVAISDIVVDDTAGAPPAGPCADTALSEPDYRQILTGAGLRGLSIDRTHQLGDGTWAVAVRAVMPLAAGAGGGALTIRPMVERDWPRVAAIYRAGIATGNATFETEVPSWDSWHRRHRPDLRFVAVGANDEPLGWVAASPVSDRCAYAGVIEHSVYVHPDHQGRGIARILLDTLLAAAAAEAAGIWTVQSGIFPENDASLALHRACGFRVVGTRQRIGKLAGRWRDVVWVERRLEIDELSVP